MKEKLSPACDKLSSRRTFIQQTAGISLLPLASIVASLPSAAAAASVDESTPQARALKYASQSPQPDQTCGNCTLYQGKPGQPHGSCPLFANSTVNKAAWCNAWIPRA